MERSSRLLRLLIITSLATGSAAVEASVTTLDPVTVTGPGFSWGGGAGNGSYYGGGSTTVDPATTCPGYLMNVCSDDYDLCAEMRKENVTLGCNVGTGTTRNNWYAGAYPAGSGLRRLFEWLGSGQPTPAVSEKLWAAISNYDRMLFEGYSRQTSDLEFLNSIVAGCFMQMEARAYAHSACYDAYNTLVQEAWPTPGLAQGLESFISELTATRAELGFELEANVRVGSVGLSFHSPANSLNLYEAQLRQEYKCRDWERRMQEFACAY